MKLFQPVVWASVMYGSETRIVTRENQKTNQHGAEENASSQNTDSKEGTKRTNLLTTKTPTTKREKSTTTCDYQDSSVASLEADSNSGVDRMET